MFKSLLIIFTQILFTALSLSAQAVPAQKDAGRKVYLFPEEQPKFPGGNEADYILKHVNWPSTLKHQTGGTVRIQFIVGSDGSVSAVEILESFDKKANAPIVLAIESMPKWTPGKVNGQSVATQIQLKIIVEFE